MRQFCFIPLKLVVILFLAKNVSLEVLYCQQSESNHSTIRVGPGSPYTTPSAAAAVAKDGDTIEILAGTYPGDAAVWHQNNLTIRGIHGRAHIRADGKSAEGKAIWVVKGNNTTIENIEFSGARVPDRNGAGIRQEGTGLVIRNCYFHDNEMGILTGKNSDSDIVIEFSEFANNYLENGKGSIGHNIYIGNVRSFTLQYCYVHHARTGHNVKSRAMVNYILYNRIVDEQTGSSSYIIDLPNGGTSYVIGNVLQQGPHNDNYHIISFGAEGLSNPQNDLYVVNNTIVNDAQTGVFIRVNSEAPRAKIMNNIFAGRGTVLHGPGELHANFVSEKSVFGFYERTPEFVNAEQYDYQLKPTSPVIDKGSDPGQANGFSLRPISHYLHVAESQARPVNGPIDIGAYEFIGK